MKMIGTHGLKILEYKLLLVRKCLYQIEWQVCMQKFVVSRSPLCTKEICDCKVLYEVLIMNTYKPV
jgi:hypothetical protein